MRTYTQKLALLVAAASIMIWLIGGSRTGFYVVSEEIPRFDPVTEIEYTERQDKFLPGIDFLGVGLILGGSFFLASFLFPKSLTSKSDSSS